MNSGYTKLFGDIVTSTIWQEPAGCRVLWITILALKDRDHICRATVPALAQLSGITIAECEGYLEKFQQPDKYSRSQEHAGRRIKPVDGGWLILNGEKYQERLSRDERREQVREAVARHRAKQTVRAPGTKPKKAKEPGLPTYHEPPKTEREEQIRETEQALHYDRLSARINGKSEA